MTNKLLLYITVLPTMDYTHSVISRGTAREIFQIHTVSKHLYLHVSYLTRLETYSPGLTYRWKFTDTDIL